MGKEKAQRPLSAQSLEAAALRYLERFQTTRVRLARHLAQKVRANGWEGDRPPDIPDLVERLAARGYLDEGAFADSRVRAMESRGLGERRIAARLRADGVSEERRAPPGPEAELARARRFAQRRRLGPFGPPPADRRAAERQFAAMLRAGHSPAVARAVLAGAAPAEDG